MDVIARQSKPFLANTAREIVVVDNDAATIGELYRKGRASMADSVRCLIEAGHRLIAKKDSMGHGEWLPWLKVNADVLGFESRFTAAKLMNAAARCAASGTFDEGEALRISRQVWGHNVRGTGGTGETEWYTPAAVIALVRELYGGEIDLDPASSDRAQETVRAAAYFTKADDGLSKQWHGNVFLNPPYRHPDIVQFLDKLLAELDAAHIDQAILLVHNYTETDWFQKAARSRHCTAICFPDGRIPFTDPAGEPCNPTQGQALLYFGNLPLQFKVVFETVGFVKT
jgi:phage N-6-adenine-methyltransferase